ncbi:hypothetical protein J3A83DRAFT_4236488, partial [Scleroderma citrinum]
YHIFKPHKRYFPDFNVTPSLSRQQWIPGRLQWLMLTYFKLHSLVPSLVSCESITSSNTTCGHMLEQKPDSMGILESAHSKFTIASNNSWFVGGYSDPVILQHIVWYKIWMLSRRAWLFLVIGQCSVFHHQLVYFLKYSTLVPAVLASVSTLMALTNSFFDDTWATFKNHTYVNHILSATLAYYLHSKHTSR